jgi:isocitrate dehydrogenase
MIAQIIKSDGGFIRACKNYDESFNKIMLLKYTNLGIDFKCFTWPNDVVESEAAYGTVIKHYRQIQKGE